MFRLLDSSSNFAALSLKDLLEARDLFHYHLLAKKNVLATALGLYRIRKEDDWPDKKHPDPRRPRKDKGRRTLFNSEIRPYSWPCIYVFVSKWEEEQRLAQEQPADVVPRCLYLPDGRAVPVCVIEARRQSYAEDLQVDPRRLFPRNLLAPGVALVNEGAQGLDRIATAGCVVRDGERFYALTNRHACGAPGTKIQGLLGHRRTEAGTAAEKGLTRVDFGDIYPHFRSSYQYLLMDIGLVELKDVTDWKTEFPGIGPVESVLDLYDHSFSLRLIGMKVVGTAAVTGQIRGEIHGLFYRYKALGGYEYLSDFLIGPETYGSGQAKEDPENKDVSLKIHHGDSGALLFIEEDPARGHSAKSGGAKKQYYPFAVLWGKQEYFEDGTKQAQPFALATSLSTALDRLNLDLVRDINRDEEFIWGWVGHYAMAGLLPQAVQLLQSESLKAFIDKNVGLLTMTPNAKLDNDPRVVTKNEQGEYDPDHPKFVPLADVPDNVWKSNVNIYMVEGEDGKKQRHAGRGSRGHRDNANHFADMDLRYKEYDTFLEFNLANLDTNPNVEDWLDYYDSVEPLYRGWEEALGKINSDPASHWGALPFRVWQLFELMKCSALAKKQDDFLCAGGVLIHYLGDACMSLHTSYLSQGDPTVLAPKPKSEGKQMRAAGVHGGYEDLMIDYAYQYEHLVDLLAQEVERQEASDEEAIDAIRSGAEAAKAVIRLIAATHKDVRPSDVVDKWVEVSALKKSERGPAMWEAFGDGTVSCMARGCRYLAKIWQGAWEQGEGDQNIGKGSARKRKDISKLYNDPKFAPSVRLDQYPAVLG